MHNIRSYQGQVIMPTALYLIFCILSGQAGASDNIPQSRLADMPVKEVTIFKDGLSTSVPEYTMM